MHRSLYLLGLILLPLSFLGISPIACGNNPTTPAATQTPSGPMVTTLAGSGSPGATNATGTAASFNQPDGIAVDSSGNVYVADSNNNLIRKITPGGVVTTLAGSGSPGSTNATGTAASFNHPAGVAVDSSFNVYVGDQSNHLIRKITSGGVVTTLAGSGTNGSANGTGTGASFFFPTGVAVDSSFNVYVADLANNLIRKITSGGLVTTLAVGFYSPTGVAVDTSGYVYVADSGNSLIRKITSGGVVSTLAGQYLTPGSANGTGTAASFSQPYGVAVDSSGIVYVADQYNYLIRRITSGGDVTTLAGSAGVTGATNATGTTASFSYPSGVAVDSSGNVYVADTSNNLIRKIQ